MENAPLDKNPAEDITIDNPISDGKSMKAKHNDAVFSTVMIFISLCLCLIFCQKCCSEEYDEELDDLSGSTLSLNPMEKKKGRRKKTVKRRRNKIAKKLKEAMKRGY